MVEIGEARMQKNGGRTARFCPHVGSELLDAAVFARAEGVLAAA